MAHQSHAPDTTFIVSELDFVFNREDGNAHLAYLSEQEAKHKIYERWEEMAELFQPGDKEEFLKEAEKYARLWRIDKNAPWPKADFSSRSMRSWDNWNAALDW